MTRTHRLLVAGFVVSLLGSWSCYLDEIDAPNGGGTGNAGTLIVNLATPNSDDGAVRVTFTGPIVTTPQSSSTNLVVYSSQRSQTTLDVIVIGDLANGPLFFVPVTDINRLSEYSVVVTEVAARDDIMRTDLSGYVTSLVGSVN
jgi:hypothetical protein